MALSFSYHGRQLPYYDHPYNDTRRNERAVEIPVALAFVERHGIDLEVGNVLRHYVPTRHRVVDRYEVAPGVDNLDVLDLTEPVHAAVTISTLEHVRCDPPEPYHPCGAIDALEHLVHLAGALLVTVPMGHNAGLDAYLLRGGAHPTRACTLVRAGTGWQQTDEPTWAPYGATTSWAESVWIGEWE